MDVLSPKNFGRSIFLVVPVTPLTNTEKTSFGEDLVKIRPAVAEQWRQQKKAHRTTTKM